MRIITTTCLRCGTVVAANELETRRVMRCPGLGCDNVLRFSDLSEDEREYVVENRDDYQM